MILNVKDLNKPVLPHHFTMEKLHKRIQIMLENYFSILINENSMNYFKLTFHGTNMHSVATSGSKDSPRVF